MQTTSWKPSISHEGLKIRARVLQEIRRFFTSRDVLEVETPVLCAGIIAHPRTIAMSTYRGLDRSPASVLYLQTSPEGAMKRLVASGSGPIYQICKAFRGGEEDSLHNPEFSILEWYRPGWNHIQMHDEVDELLHAITGRPRGQRFSYADLFRRELGIDLVTADYALLQTHVLSRRLVDDVDMPGLDKDDLLELLMKKVIEPTLGWDAPAFVYEFPASQACLARVTGATADRFEVFIDGIELVSCYYELADPDEHLRRLAIDQERCRTLGLEPLPLNDRFLAAIRAGFPECAGAALGVDRLVMLVAGSSSLNDVVAFPINIA